MSERRLLPDKELADIRQRLEHPARADKTLLAHAGRAMLAHAEALAGLLVDMQIDSLAYQEGVKAGRIERNAENVAELGALETEMNNIWPFHNEDYGNGYLSGINDAIHSIKD